MRPTVIALAISLSCFVVYSNAQQRSPDVTAAERGAEAAPVAAPELLVGQHWTYRRMDLWRNEETESFNQYLIAEVPGYWAVAWTILTSKDAQRLGSVTPERLFTAGHGFNDLRMTGLHEPLRFPLVAGKSWEFRYKFSPKSGSTTTVTQTATVRGWETVKVPAGSFRALRVDHVGTYTTVESSNQWSGQIRETFWYAPSARRVVMHEYQDTGGDGATWDKRRDELVGMLL